MEYYTGQTLAEKLITQKTVYENFTDIAWSVFDAVEAIHRAEVIHRDIKPSNILILDDGSVRLIDFGLVKSTGNEKDISLTATGTALGTMYYISPEQYADSKDVDIRTDIYSMGATFYHMMCGVPPVFGKSDIEFYNRMRDFVITHPSEINPDVTRLTGNWIMKALSREPEDRYASVPEFRDSYPGDTS
jgi:serine/threonine-protein kinase